jgi:hypothetical protein
VTLDELADLVRSEMTGFRVEMTGIRADIKVLTERIDRLEFRMERAEQRLDQVIANQLVMSTSLIALTTDVRALQEMLASGAS